jgi:CRP-like cAMP-binding protein
MAATRISRRRPKDLGDVALFRTCSTTELCRVRRNGDIAKVRAQTTIQSDASLDWVYVVLDGTVRLTELGQHVLLGPGDVAGACSSLAGTRPRVDMVAVTDVTLFVLGRREFLGLARNMPGLGFGVAQFLASHGRYAVSA